MKTFIILMFCLMPSQIFAPPDSDRITLMESIQFQLLFCDFNPDVVKQALNELVMYPDIVYAQIRLETGEVTSNIFKENKNMFGMHPPAKRKTYCIGENRHCAVYDNYLYSILDYALLQKYYFDQGLGMNEILKKYCPEPTYRIKLKNLMT